MWLRAAVLQDRTDESAQDRRRSDARGAARRSMPWLRRVQPVSELDRQQRRDPLRPLSLASVPARPARQCADARKTRADHLGRLSAPGADQRSALRTPWVTEIDLGTPFFGSPDRGIMR